MTHDKLLIEINRRLDVALYNGDPQIAHALREVLELHKPMEGNEHLCSACWFGDGMMAYPCPTIQAIEKELK
jgi:hypothetical protein